MPHMGDYGLNSRRKRGALVTKPKAPIGALPATPKIGGGALIGVAKKKKKPRRGY